MMRTERTDADRIPIEFNVRESRQSFDVDETLVFDQTFLHREKKLGTAGINLRGIAEPRQQFGNFAYAFRLFEAKSSEHLTKLLLPLAVSRPGQIRPSPDRLSV